jgi:hypothetical protein
MVVKPDYSPTTSAPSARRSAAISGGRTHDGVGFDPPEDVAAYKPATPRKARGGKIMRPAKVNVIATHAHPHPTGVGGADATV